MLLYFEILISTNETFLFENRDVTTKNKSGMHKTHSRLAIGFEIWFTINLKQKKNIQECLRNVMNCSGTRRTSQNAKNRSEMFITILFGTLFNLWFTLKLICLFLFAAWQDNWSINYTILQTCNCYRYSCNIQRQKTTRYYVLNDPFWEMVRYSYRGRRGSFTSTLHVFPWSYDKISKQSSGNDFWDGGYKVTFRKK